MYNNNHKAELSLGEEAPLKLASTTLSLCQLLV